MRCPDCRLDKPAEEFTRSRSRKSGFGSYCKECFNRRAKASKEKRHGGHVNYLLKHRYGIDAATLAWLSLQQDGRCAICRDDLAEHVDHDHGSDLVRGLLCFNCNRALGYAGDETDVLHALLRYLGGTGRVCEAPAPYLIARRTLRVR